ncbi:hypothetical protein NC651_025737 [Populus alba x Populus x berolinensis]|nr:hypothetical protein NC651_025737 [Populus alba x Populus x berolinensis]
MPICLSFLQPRRLQEIGPCEDGYLMKQLKTRLGILDLDTLEILECSLMAKDGLYPSMHLIKVQVRSVSVQLCRTTSGLGEKQAIYTRTLTVLDVSGP